MDKKRLAEELRKTVKPEADGIHIHIHLDQPQNIKPEEKKEKPEWVDDDGYVKVAGMHPSVS
jgi:hypothetical protein